MTDYLEELLDNTAALLEQVRRLERSASGPGLERAGEGEPSPAFRAAEESAEETAINRWPEAGETLRAAERRETERVSGAASGGGERESGAPEPPERVLTPLEEERRPEGSVLLEQMERLERAAASEPGGGVPNRSAAWDEAGAGRRNGYSAGLTGALPGSVFPGVAGAAGEGWALGAGFAGTGVQPGEELRWAERADRAFRRDSRRYDGGFYLY